MRLYETLRRIILAGVSNNIDLLALWVLLIAIQPQIPIGNVLSRPDLIPWLMFCLACTALLRGREYGDGPHTSLTKQVSSMGALMRLAARLLIPFLCVLLYDLGFHSKLVLDKEPEGLVFLSRSIVFLVVFVCCLTLSKSHEKTAWNPRGISSTILWFLAVFVFVPFIVGIGFVANHYPNVPCDAILLGTAFLLCGLLTGRVRHFRQRRRAGCKDGSSYVPALFNYIFSPVGSAFGLWALYKIQEEIGLGEKVSFEQAFVPAALIVAWAGVVWPKPLPIAVTCLLHEIMPAGGGDASVSTTASPFDKPPEGALRINPLFIRRIRSTHPWLVPVKASRVPELDDPILPLWQRVEPPPAYHIMGDASFEPDPYTNKEQWNEITIRLRGSDDVGSVGGSAANNRSIVVLKPFLSPGVSKKKRLVTYKWEKAVPQASIQNVDATTETLSLEDGCIIILATEGVARAFELEICTPVYRLTEAANFRPPQLEDYVKL